MKRIISILAVFCLIVSLAVPTFAVSSPTVSGVWVFNETIDVLALKALNLGAVPINFTFRGISKTSMKYATVLPNNTPAFAYDSYVTYVSDTGWKDEGDKTVDFGSEPQTVPEAFYDWLLDNATPPSCDGSTCPATDVNRDNVCDDCGMTFALLRDYTPSDFPSGYPAVPSLDMPNARYFLYQVRSSEYTYLVVYPSTVTPTFDSTVQNGQLHFAESYGNFRLDRTNNEWVMSSDTTPYDIGGYTGNVQALYSSVQIYDEENEPFFPIPLWMEMEKVTQGEMSQTTTTVVGTMKTLVLCGVGCLALLVVLSLFGKRSLISLR